MSLVSWNLINYCKILEFLVEFSKSPKGLRKILLKWLGKRVKYQLNFINFCSCTEKWLKVGQLWSITLTQLKIIKSRVQMPPVAPWERKLAWLCKVCTVVKHSTLNPKIEGSKAASLGHAPALLANITLGWKGLPGTNTQAIWSSYKNKALWILTLTLNDQKD